MRLAQPLFGLGVLYVVGRYIYKSWVQVSRVDFALNPALFVFGLLALGSFYTIYALTWQRILAWMSDAARSMRRVTLARIFFSSLLTRYLPAGKAVNVGSRIELYKRAGGRRLIAAQSMVFDQVYLMGGAIVLACLAVVVTPAAQLPEAVQPYRGILILGGLGMSLLLLFGIDGILIWFFRVTKLSERYTLGHRLRLGQSLELFSRYLAINILQGLGAFLFVASIFPALRVGGVYTVIQLSAYPVSRMVGQAAAVVPGGLGVREGVYAFLLGVTMPVQAAVLGAGITRLVSVLLEFIVNLVLVAIENQDLFTKRQVQ